MTVRDLLFVGQYEAAAQALVDTRLASDPFRLMPPELRARMPPLPEPFRLFASSLIMRDAPDHSRLRKLVQPSFGPRAMEALAPRIQRIADQLLDAAEQQAEARGEHAPERRMDLLRAFAHPLPVAVISDLLGIPEEDRESVRTWAAFRAESRNPAIIAETTQKFVAFSGYLRALFERKRQAPADDMISQMIHAQEDGDRLSEEELLSMIFLLYLAGHVTTVNLIASGTLALLTHPSELAKVRANPELMKNAVEEILRYWGPLDTTLPRFATENMVIGGVEIPRGETILVGLSSSNHDPQRFAQPEVFDITREDANRHIAFGKGIHVCLGAPLARMEGDIALTTLLARYPELRLAVPAGEIRWKPGFLRALEALPLAF